jgi:hypothetical protein
MDAVRYDESAAWSASRIGFEAQRSCDTDGDGVADHNDADSDNDGIPDIVEAGGVDANSDGLVDGAFTDADNDGWSNVFDADNGGTALSDPDSDGDGTLNRLDLDEDNDGIANVIEAGGTDNDGDGRQDVPFDSDGDGFANIFDSDNGGSALYAIDTDNDGIVNYLDFDSDGDGIDDNLEGMTTAGFRAENGDFSNDGWDTEYNGNAGGTPINLSDNDADGTPDYFDLDTDGDGLPDWMEGFDDDNSEDALNDLLTRGDNYEIAEGNPLKYVNTDDADADGVPDWLEDGDADNIPSFQDPDEIHFFDTDNDGLIDLYDIDNGGVPSNVPDGDGDGEYDFRDTDNQISLPVELIDFAAIAEGERSKLIWITESETNNDYFLIERAGEDGNFQPIAQVDGAGNSNSRLDYFTYDENPLEGNNYYRLKQIDFNGEFSYSPVEMVNFAVGSSAFMLYPNPTKGDQLFVSFDQFASGRYLIQIIDMQGNLILSRTIVIENETIWFELEILKGEKLAAGNYLLNLASETKKMQLKFTVTR